MLEQISCEEMRQMENEKYKKRLRKWLDKDPDGRGVEIRVAFDGKEYHWGVSVFFTVVGVVHRYTTFGYTIWEAFDQAMENLPS